MLCGALWLALIDRLALDELVTGVIAASLGATAAVLVREQRRIVTRPRSRWLRSTPRPLAALLLDLWPLLCALIFRGILRRRTQGAVHALDFPVAGHTPHEAAFRVHTAALGSLGPNTIVLDIDVDDGVLYAHQLVARAHPERAAMPLGRRP